MGWERRHILFWISFPDKQPKHSPNQAHLLWFAMHCRWKHDRLDPNFFQKKGLSDKENYTSQLFWNKEKPNKPNSGAILHHWSQTIGNHVLQKPTKPMEQVKVTNYEQEAFSVQQLLNIISSVNYIQLQPMS